MEKLRGQKSGRQDQSSIIPGPEHVDELVPIDKRNEIVLSEPLTPFEARGRGFHFMEHRPDPAATSEAMSGMREARLEVIGALSNGALVTLPSRKRREGPENLRTGGGNKKKASGGSRLMKTLLNKTASRGKLTPLGRPPGGGGGVELEKTGEPF